MGKISQNLRYALRLLAKSRGFTFMIVLTLAVGIGAATTVFSIAESILWKPLPFTDSERLVAIFAHSANTRQEGLVSVPDFLDWQADSRSFSAIAAYGGGENRTVSGGAEVVRSPVDTVTTNFLSTIGAARIRGRDFLPGEAEPGRNHIAIVSEQFWERQFPGIPVTAQRTIRLDDVPFEVIAVLPRNLHLENFGLHDILTPLPLDSTLVKQRDARTLEIVGRLNTGVNLKQSQMELNTLCAQLSHLYPATNLNWGARVESLRESIVSPSYRTTLRLFVGASILLLFAACVNAAGLLLARILNRSREFAVRAALGAGHKELLEQLLAESLLLGGIAGCLGIAFAWCGTRAFTVLAASSNVDVPRLAEISVDVRALVFAATISQLVAIVMGLVPARAGTKPDVTVALQASSRTATSSRQNQALRSFFVVVQFSLAAVLLVGAGLFTRSLVQLQHLDPGFEPHGVLSAYISLSGPRYADSRQTTLFTRALEERIRSTPGIVGAAIASRLPIVGGSQVRVSVEGQADPQPGAEPFALYSSVTPGYFDVLHIPLLHGRVFTDNDKIQSDRIAIVNENFARKNFPGTDPVGHHLRILGPATPGEPQPGPVQIVGVTANAHAVGLDEVPFAEVYFPLAQEPARDLYIALRSAPHMPVNEVSLRTAVAALDKDVPLSDIKTMDARVADSLGENRFNMVLIGATASMALLLAVLGTYGVISFSVARRTREIGIRTALRAQRASIVQLVLQQGVKLAAAGVGVGVAVALVLGKLFGDALYLAPQVHNGLLYGVTPHDPLTFLAVVFVLVTSAVVGCFSPALRATRVDPIVALRYE